MSKGTICLDFFIQRASEMGFHGDNRNFDANAPASRSRVQVLIAPNHSVTLVASPSCFFFLCHSPSAKNTATVGEGKNGSFTVNVTATNSAALGLAPSINASVTFTPNGKGGFITHGSRDFMPSLGIYQSTGSGWKTLNERNEVGGPVEGFYLYPSFPKDIW